MSLVITDGLSNNPEATQQAAQLAKDDGIITLAIGVGPNSNLQELTGIASEPKKDHWTYLESFGGLRHLAEVLSQNCPPQIPGGENETWPMDCEVGLWTGWTECSAPCGGGQIIRSRPILRNASDGGSSCPETI